MFRTQNPATGEVLEEFPAATDEQVEAALSAAVDRFADWSRRPIQERTPLLERIAAALESRSREYGETMATEMGKPIAQGIAEAEKCAWVCRFYAENAAGFLAPRRGESDGSSARVRHDPLGPILAVMPWNFPFWQVLRFSAPAIAAGNAVLLKHSGNVPRCARAIERLFQEAGAPEALFQNLFATHDQAARLIEDPRLRGVTLTGSDRAGRAIGARAGGAIKPMVAELGGSDPFIVFADADLEEAVSVGVTARCINNGQSCIAAKRFLVERPAFDGFLEAFAERMAGQSMGDPLEEETEIGPLARVDLRDQLHDQVRRSLEAGARAVTGAADPEGPGAFYEPTVLTDIPADAPAAREELFGPVASFFPFEGEEEAIEIANGTEFGLGASLWTSDGDRATRLVPRIDAGSVFVNGMVKSDPRLPFGGVKSSGYGRELGREGILEFVNAKTVWIA